MATKYGLPAGNVERLSEKNVACLDLDGYEHNQEGSSYQVCILWMICIHMALQK